MKKSDENKAKASADKLEKQIGQLVSVNYGAPNIVGEIQYFLVVHSDDKKLRTPSEFEGYKVFKRAVPRPL